MQRLGLEHLGGDTRRSAQSSQFYRGVALVWAGYPSDADAALEPAKTLGTNTIDPRPGRRRSSIRVLPADRRAVLSGLQPTAPNPLLEQGSRLQVEGHQISAERLYARGARSSIRTTSRRSVAEAVGLFDEDNLSPTFSRLGPLDARFPRSQIVRYYLGSCSPGRPAAGGDHAVRADGRRSARRRPIGKAGDATPRGDRERGAASTPAS